jgi:Glycosyl hydrolase family 47
LGSYRLNFPAGFSFTVRSLEPLFEHIDPSLAVEEEDDSARCRLSGICEGRPTQQECSQSYIEYDKKLGNNFIPSYEFAARRDASLACVFTSKARAERVRDAARWTWKGYKDCAHGLDELRPLSCSGQDWHKLQLTAVDAMDTLALMNLHQEFNEALHLIREQLKPTEECNVFETTIRILGGLLSTHHIVTAHYNPEIDGDAHESTSLDLLNTAIDVGSRLLQAFNSPSGIPYSDINLSTGSISRSVQHSSMAETTTLSLEFTLLSRLTGEESFEKAVLKVHEVLKPSIEKHDGLIPQLVSPADGSMSGEYFMLGARSDSYYEYLLKQWILTGRSDELMLNNYKQAIRAVRKRLLRRTTSGGLLYIAEETGNVMSPKMDHLVCFLPGVLALGDFYNISTTIQPETNSTTANSTKNYYYDASDLEIAEQLAETCYQMYRRTPTGLAPEIVFFTTSDDDSITSSRGSGTNEAGIIANNESGSSSSAVEGYPGAHASDIGGGDFMVKEDDAHNLLRPETVESLFILWKVTGNKKYQEQAWLIFRAFEKWTRVEGVQQCLAVDAEAAAGTATKEVARVAALEAAKALAAGARGTKLTPEQAIKKGIDAGKAALEAMRLPATTTEGEISGNGGATMAEQAQLVSNACLGAAEAAATATVQLLVSSNATFTVDDIPDVFQLKRAVAATTTILTTNGGQQQARVCDFSVLPGGGYSNLESVKSIPPPRRDKMESFWIAETLKYLYLIFTEPPDRCLNTPTSCKDWQGTAEENGHYQAVLPLTEFVFNTEAHPLPIVGPIGDSLIKAVAEIDRKLLNPFKELSNEPVELGNEEEEEEEEQGDDVEVKEGGEEEEEDEEEENDGDDQSEVTVDFSITDSDDGEIPEELKEDTADAQDRDEL